MRSQAGLSMVEALVGLTMVALMFAGMASLVAAMGGETRSMSDTVEAIDLERQLAGALADDGVCTCQLANASALEPDGKSFTGATVSQKVRINKIGLSCEDTTKIFAEVGGQMKTQSGSFVVDTIQVRDLVPTGRRDPTTGQLDEYTGSFFVQFRGRTSGRKPRPIKVGKIFSTGPGGKRLKTCASADGVYFGPMVSNTVMTGSLDPSIASCPPGYSIVSGGWKLDYQDPTCPTYTNPGYPVVTESFPVVGAGGQNGWRVVANCVTAAAVAMCQRGH